MSQEKRNTCNAPTRFRKGKVYPGPRLRDFSLDFAPRHFSTGIVGDTHRDKGSGQSRMEVVFKQTKKTPGWNGYFRAFLPPRPISQITFLQHSFLSRIPSLPPHLETALLPHIPLSVWNFGCVRLPRPLLSYFTDRSVQHRHRPRRENHFLSHNR